MPRRLDRPMLWRPKRQAIHTVYDYTDDHGFLIQTDTGQHWVPAEDIDFERKRVLRIESVPHRTDLGLVQWTHPDLRSMVLPVAGKKQKRMRAVRWMLDYDGWSSSSKEYPSAFAAR